MGLILNNKVTKKKYKNVKNVAINRPQKTFVYNMRTETRRQSMYLFDLGWELMLGGWNFLSPLTRPLYVFERSANDDKSGARIDLGITNQF